ncbi:Hypothetical protein MexAM1_META2p0282 (plasmid) [Methylorubrum extorquens AM1]|uniref:Uncharacterized protein n=1 Tax=Methylorubrum extorquens (strain ATCC 14718 / DSM 1338 / JCM 2805 / NCIMB 9133 / AM1) TaxID=272630 RepID=C5B3Y1_METEA|nr:Hypothetical protein MexAM1_META2p0282 [Methylorubrum extorquens AM1]
MRHAARRSRFDEADLYHGQVSNRTRPSLGPFEFAAGRRSITQREASRPGDGLLLRVACPRRPAQQDPAPVRRVACLEGEREKRRLSDAEHPRAAGQYRYSVCGSGYGWASRAAGKPQSLSARFPAGTVQEFSKKYE